MWREVRRAAAPLSSPPPSIALFCGASGATPSKCRKPPTEPRYRRRAERRARHPHESGRARSQAACAGDIGSQARPSLIKGATRAVQRLDGGGSRSRHASVPGRRPKVQSVPLERGPAWRTRRAQQRSPRARRDRWKQVVFVQRGRVNATCVRKRGDLTACCFLKARRLVSERSLCIPPSPQPNAPR